MNMQCVINRGGWGIPRRGCEWAPGEAPVPESRMRPEAATPVIIRAYFIKTCKQQKHQPDV